MEHRVGRGGKTPGTIRVMLVDDEQLVRAGLSLILSTAPDIEIVAATDGPGALEAAHSHDVDVVLCDVRMPGVDGLQVLRGLLRLPRPPQVAMLTTFAADDVVAEALRSGASGYVLKDVDPDLLIEHVRALADHTPVLSAGVTGNVIDGFLAGRPGQDEVRAVARLSPREREVLALVTRGGTNDQIAAALTISLPTVKDHVRAIMRKFGVDSRVRVVLVGVRAGLDPGQPLQGSAYGVRGA